MPSIKKLLTIKGNNYTKLTKLFKREAGLDIVKDGYNKKIPLKKSCSIIIPFYANYSSLKRNLTSLLYQDLLSDFKRNKTEIIIVDGGSSTNLKNLFKPIQRFYPITYLKLKKNYGRATARNLGLLYARNEIIFFLDEDIVVPKDFLATHLLRHQFIDNCIIVGFRHNVSLREFNSKPDNSKQKILRRPNYRKDFRYKRFVPKEWKVIHRNIPYKNFNKTYYILKESNYFKKFGRGKIIGIWDLPYMFLTCSASVPRKHVLEVGGFDMRFKGWNLEDTYLGAKLISRGLYLIPNLHATVYHLIKEIKESLTGRYQREKIKEYKKNVKLYNKLKNENVDFYTENEWREKMKKYFVNKFIDKTKL